MISGGLYLDRKRTWNLKKLWTHSILPIAVAYIFWQVFYALYRSLTDEGLKFGSVAFFKRFLVMISDSYFHLWYLPMLIGLLIITPMLWEIVNSKNGKQWEEYMILLYLIFKILPYTVKVFPIPCKEHVMNVLNTVQPQMVTGFVGYYIAGHYLYQYGVSKKLEKLIYILGIVSISMGILFCYIRSQQKGTDIQDFYENYLLALLPGHFCTFVFKNYVSKIKWNDKQEKRICFVGSCTFGIFLIHVLVRSLLHKAGIDSMMISNTFIAIPIVIALIFTLSFGAVVIIKKIPVLKKWIV